MSYIEILNNFSLLIGFGVITIGFLAILKPKFMSKNFGIPIEGKALSYISSLGIRDIFIGLILFYMFYIKAWLAIAFINLCICLVALTDFIVVIKHGNKKNSFTHLAGLIVSLIYAILMYTSHS